MPEFQRARRLLAASDVFVQLHLAAPTDARRMQDVRVKVATMTEARVPRQVRQ